MPKVATKRYAGDKVFIPRQLMDEKDFQRRAGDALDDLNRRLAKAGDEYGFEADLNSGALTLEFDEPSGRFVVSPNSPVRQIWVSALTRSFKLDWDEQRGAFVLPQTGQTLMELIETAISQHLGEPVTL